MIEEKSSAEKLKEEKLRVEIEKIKKPKQKRNTSVQVLEQTNRLLRKLSKM